MGTSSSAKLYLVAQSRAPSVCTSVLNPKRPSDCNSGDPVKQSATPLEQLKGIVRMFASESGSRTVKEKLAVVYNLVVGMMMGKLFVQETVIQWLIFCLLVQ